MIYKRDEAHVGTKTLEALVWRAPGVRSGRDGEGTGSIYSHRPRATQAK